MSEPLSHLPERKLTKVEEIELAKKIKKGDAAARQELVMHTMREAIKYSRRVTGEQIPDAQLASACYDVLNRGAIRFNPRFGKRFFAFSKVGIRGWCRNIFREREVVKGAKRVETEEKPIKRAPAMPDHAWDDKDVIAPECEIVEPDFKGILIRERMELVSQVMARVCTRKEKQVLALAYIAGFNYQEVADKIAVSRAAVQAMAAKALHKIRKELFRRKRLFND